MTPDRNKLSPALKSLYQRRVHGIRPGLKVIRRLLDLMGHPENAFRAVHIAGTNGKGSVAVMIAAMLQRAGYHVGLYTSPHLCKFNERIRIDGECIGDEELADVLGFCESAAARVGSESDMRPPTFFEMSTAAALEAFRRQNVEIAVVETGMGGRWDATNTVRSVVSVITQIGLDHTRFLGETLKEIAGEKAGIIRKGVPVVHGGLPDEVRQVIYAEAAGKEADCVDARERVRVEPLKADLKGQSIALSLAGRIRLEECRLNLTGAHQRENCALAICACERLGVLDDERTAAAIIDEGLAGMRWPGRCQVVEGQPPILLDGAHNPDGAGALCRTLMEMGGERRWGWIVGFLDDKDCTGFMQAIGPTVERVWAVPVRSERAMRLEETVARIRAAGFEVEQAGALPMALKEARAWAADAAGGVCVSGSLYLVGECLEMLGIATCG